MSKVIAFVFARGGSKGLPGKNLRLLNGKPLLAYSIEFARQSSVISDVIVSTDSEEIAAVAKKFGARVPFMRPRDLATDDAPEMLAWRHAIRYVNESEGDFDIFVSLPTVSPFRSHKDLQAAIERVKRDDCDFVLTGVRSEANPYFNLIEKTENGLVNLSKESKSSRRQEAPEVFRIVPMIYACRPEAALKYDRLFSARVALVEVEASRAFDVDTLEDFNYLEYMSQTKGLDLCTK